jgi:hypothetical protein
MIPVRLSEARARWPAHSVRPCVRCQIASRSAPSGTGIILLSSRRRPIAARPALADSSAKPTNKPRYAPVISMIRPDNTGPMMSPRVPAAPKVPVIVPNHLRPKHSAVSSGFSVFFFRCVFNFPWHHRWHHSFKNVKALLSVYVSVHG